MIKIAIIIPLAIIYSSLASWLFDIKPTVDFFLINFVFGLIILFIFALLEYQIIKDMIFKKYNPKYKIKIGLDVHNCIDYDPVFFSELSNTLVENGHEVHITTGAFITEELKKELTDYKMKWTHLWSISDYYKNKPGVDIWYDERGRPWVEDDLWNRAKGDYAKSQNLDLTLDDTEIYKNYFSNSIAICNIVNKSGKVRGKKAVMPPKPSFVKTNK